MSTVTIIPPGQETDEQYHASGAWGSTLISTFLRSPKLANLMRTGVYRREPTAAMTFGTRFHRLMDPGSGFATTYRVGPDADKRSKAWKEAEAAATADVFELIDSDDWQALHAMRESVLANPIAASLLASADHEVGFRIRSPYGPFDMQCKADMLVRPSVIADFKTAADLDDFAKSIVSHGYHRQAALYRWIIGQAVGEQLPFSFIVVEKQAPLYRCRVIDLTDDFLALGWQEVEAALIEIGRRSAANDFDDHDHVQVIEPPTWLLDRRRSSAA